MHCKNKNMFFFSKWLTLKDFFLMNKFNHSILEHIVATVWAASQSWANGEKPAGSKILSFLWALVLKRLKRNLPVSGSHFKNQESHSLWNSFHPFQLPQVPHCALSSRTLASSRACPPGVLLHQANQKRLPMVIPSVWFPSPKTTYLWLLPSFFQTSLKSLQGRGTSVSVQNQLPASSDACITNSLLACVLSPPTGSFPLAYKHIEISSILKFFYNLTLSPFDCCFLFLFFCCPLKKITTSIYWCLHFLFSVITVQACCSCLGN